MKSQFSYEPREEYTDGKVPHKHKRIVDQGILEFQKERVARTVLEVDRLYLKSTEEVPIQDLVQAQRDLTSVMNGFKFIAQRIAPRVHNGSYDRPLNQELDSYLVEIGHLRSALRLFGFGDVADVLHPLHLVNPAVN